MESFVHQLIWFESCKYNFYFWNQFLILVYSNLQKSPPWKLKSYPKSGKSQNHLHNAHNRPLGAISPTLNTLVKAKENIKHFLRNI